jgi:hypothetical protein
VATLAHAPAPKPRAEVVARIAALMCKWKITTAAKMAMLTDLSQVIETWAAGDVNANA